jgi:outer membrane protein OmpA-like peptidoglycan-associated protein
MKILIGVFWVWFGLLFLTSCASNRNHFVLLPDPDGHVGKITLSNKGGSQVLGEAGQAVMVKTQDIAPGPPYLLTENQIKELFGEALSAQPEPPLKFLLYFKTGTSDLTEESEKLLSEILNSIKARNSTDISIVGHTDRVGSRESNYRLALDRAKGIKNLFIHKGVQPDIIEVDSHGEDNPLVNTEDEVPEPRNRRVEAIIR